MTEDRRFGLRTRALHAGAPPDPKTGARALPLYLSSSFVFAATEHAAELFALRSYGNIYSRIRNPTVSAFEERMASLEGGLGSVATSSGLAAQMLVVLSLAQAGDHLVATASLYGGTVTQFTVTLRRMGIACTLVAGDDPEDVRRAIRPNTRLVFAETIGNPRVGTSLTWTHSRPSRASPAFRSSSTTRSRRPRSAVPSSTAPISWFIQRRSFWAVTER